MHINFAVFNKVLPGPGEKHIFDFHRLSKLRKYMQIIIVYMFFVFGCLLEPLGIILGRLGVNLGQNYVNVGATWTNMPDVSANLTAQDGPGPLPKPLKSTSRTVAEPASSRRQVTQAGLALTGCGLPSFGIGCAPTNNARS